MSIRPLRGAREASQADSAQRNPTASPLSAIEIERLNRLRESSHRFVEEACHDMRTPVTVIKAFSAILIEEAQREMGDDHTRLLQTIAGRADELNRMIDGLLDVSRVESEEITANRKCILLQDVVEQIRPVLEELAGNAALTVAVDAPVPVFCDATAIGNVIRELVGNAARSAGEKGEIELSARYDAGAREVLVSVTDHGARVAPEDIDIAFDRYQSIYGAGITGAKGYVRGLSIANEIVRVNLGELGVKSSARENTFHFTVPTFDLDSLLSRFLIFLHDSRKLFSEIAIVSIEASNDSEPKALEAIEQFLAGQLASSDFAIPAPPGRWVLCLACENSGRAVAGLEEALDEVYRAQPNQRPELSIQLVGSWSMQGDAKELGDLVRRVYSPGEDTTQDAAKLPLRPLIDRRERASASSNLRPEPARPQSSPPSGDRASAWTRTPAEPAQSHDTPSKTTDRGTTPTHATQLAGTSKNGSNGGTKPGHSADLSLERSSEADSRSNTMQANRRILIADDDPAILRSLSAQCQKLGLEVSTANNGLQAILKAKKDSPRLLILDVNMPEADGFRVCEWMFDKKQSEVDVVMLTARSDLETLDRCDSLGTYHVHKGPETWTMLKSILGEILGIEDGALESFAPEQTDQTGQLLVDKVRNKVLIVEDDADLGFALERRLKKCGAVTFRAANGIEGYRIAVNEKPDVVITDYVMPDAGGHYMIWRLRSTEGTKHIPVIVITGQRLVSGRDIPTEAEKEGTVGPVKYFEKPLDVDALFNELSRHCSIQFEPFANAAA